MLLTLFWIAVGIVIGWNLPQPLWARELQDKAMDALKGRR
jgi:type III secretory pathway component EscT